MHVYDAAAKSATLNELRYNIDSIIIKGQRILDKVAAEANLHVQTERHIILSALSTKRRISVDLDSEYEDDEDDDDEDDSPDLDSEGSELCF